MLYRQEPPIERLRERLSEEATNAEMRLNAEFEADLLELSPYDQHLDQVRHIAADVSALMIKATKRSEFRKSPPEDSSKIYTGSTPEIMRYLINEWSVLRETARMPISHEYGLFSPIIMKDYLDIELGDNTAYIPNQTITTGYVCSIPTHDSKDTYLFDTKKRTLQEQDSQHIPIIIHEVAHKFQDMAEGERSVLYGIGIHGIKQVISFQSIGESSDEEKPKPNPDIDSVEFAKAFVPSTSLHYLDFLHPVDPPAENNSTLHAKIASHSELEECAAILQELREKLS